MMRHYRSALYLVITQIICLCHLYLHQKHINNISKTQRSRAWSPLAHRCTIFLCHLDLEIQHRVVTPYRRLQIRNSTAKAKISQSGSFFWKIRIVHMFQPTQKFWLTSVTFMGVQGAFFQGAQTFCSIWASIDRYRRHRKEKAHHSHQEPPGTVGRSSNGARSPFWDQPGFERNACFGGQNM